MENFRLSMAKMFFVGSPWDTATLAAYGESSIVACGVLWESGPRSECQRQARIFIIFSKTFCLQQFISDATRGNKTLAFLLSNNDQFTHSIKVTASALSDHNLVTSKCDISTRENNMTTNHINYAISFKKLNLFSDKINWDYTTISEIRYRVEIENKLTKL